MATLEHEQLIPGGQSRPGEQHIFVSPYGRRQRALRLAGLLAGALALVWLVALGLAMVGSARLAGLPVPGAQRVAFARDASATAAVPAPRRHSPTGGHEARAASSTPGRVEPQSASARTNPARTTAPATTPPAVLPAPAASVTSATPPLEAATPSRHGWARRGWTVPPGQTKRDQPAARGAGHSTDAAGTTTTSATRGDPHGKKG